MNKKNSVFALVIAFLFFLSIINYVSAAPTCLDGAIISCTTTDGCPGTQTCTLGAWGPCIDTPDDGCPVTATLTVNWYAPSISISPATIGNPTLAFNAKVTCNAAPCNDVTATMQYCEGASCSNYQNMTNDCSAGLCLTSGTNATYSLGNFITGQIKYPDWNWITWNTDYIQGKTFNLRINAAGSNVNTEYLTGFQLVGDNRSEVTINTPANGTLVEPAEIIPIKWATSDADGENMYSTIYYNSTETYWCTYAPTSIEIYASPKQPAGTYDYNWTVPSIEEGSYCIWIRVSPSLGDSLLEGIDSISIIYATSMVVSVNNLAGDTSDPYLDGINDEKTDLVLDIVTNDATQCKYSLDSGFDPATQGTACTINNPSSSTCELGNLSDNNYTYYYSCKNTALWSVNQNIDFTVDLTSLLSATIISPLGQDFSIGSNIDFNSSFFDNLFDYTVKWDSNKDLDWIPSDKNFSFSGLSIGDHNLTLSAFFYTGGTKPVIKTDSVNIRILPIPTDVLGIVGFNLVYKKWTGTEYSITKKLTTSNNHILLYAYVTNSTSQNKDANITITLLNAETGETIQTYQGPAYPALNSIITPGEVKEITQIISVTSLDPGNYKIKFEIKEHSLEQNTANNSITKIVSLLKETKKVNASELSVLILPAIIVIILVILNKEKIRKFASKKKQIKAKEKNK